MCFSGLRLAGVDTPRIQTMVIGLNLRLVVIRKIMVAGRCAQHHPKRSVCLHARHIHGMPACFRYCSIGIGQSHQATYRTKLWNKLVTGTVNIDSYNPDFCWNAGQSGADASLAIQNDSGIAPNKINDLAITGIAQEFATLTHGLCPVMKMTSNLLPSNFIITRNPSRPTT